MSGIHKTLLVNQQLLVNLKLNDADCGVNVVKDASFTASSVLNEGMIPHAFDTDLSTQWVSAMGNALPQWLQASFPGVVTVASYTILGHPMPCDDYCWQTPSAWKLLGSNDQITWTVLDDRSQQTLVSPTTYDIAAAPGAFKFIRIMVTDQPSGGWVVNVAIAHLSFCIKPIPTTPSTISPTEVTPLVPIVVVTNLVDSVAASCDLNSDSCNLRACVAYFSGTKGICRLKTGTHALTFGEITIGANSNIHITGTSAASTIIDGSGQFTKKFLLATEANVVFHLSYITVRNFKQQAEYSGCNFRDALFGGAILLKSGDAYINNAVFIGNENKVGSAIFVGAFCNFYMKSTSFIENSCIGSDGCNNQCNNQGTVFIGYGATLPYLIQDVNFTVNTGCGGTESIVVHIGNYQGGNCYAYDGQWCFGNGYYADFPCKSATCRQPGYVPITWPSSIATDPPTEAPSSSFPSSSVPSSSTPSSSVPSSSDPSSSSPSSSFPSSSAPSSSTPTSNTPSSSVPSSSVPSSSTPSSSVPSSSDPSSSSPSSSFKTHAPITGIKTVGTFYTTQVINNYC